MGLLQKTKIKKIHTRNISISTYSSGEDSIIVEGKLKDDRLTDYYLITGEKKSAGVIHNMIIRMLISPPGLTIKEVEVEMLESPRPECPKTKESLKKITGLKISSGFTKKIKILIGGKKGCAHLTNLILTMAPAAVQGFYTHYARKPAQGENLGAMGKFMAFIEDTCYVWRKDGDLLKKIKEKINKKNTP